MYERLWYEKLLTKYGELLLRRGLCEDGRVDGYFARVAATCSEVEVLEDDGVLCGQRDLGIDNK